MSTEISNLTDNIEMVFTQKDLVIKGLMSYLKSYLRPDTAKAK